MREGDLKLERMASLIPTKRLEERLTSSLLISEKNVKNLSLHLK